MSGANQRDRDLIGAGRTCEDCGKPTSMGCARCGRILCAWHGACNLTSLVHITGLACDPLAPKGIPELCTTCGHVPAAHVHGDGWCTVCPDSHCQIQETPTDAWGLPSPTSTIQETT